METILLVEDEAIIALAGKNTLEGFGYGVALARSGEAAVETALRSGTPIDLILMDIDLGPGMDGTEAARRILAERNLPIVFLTAHSEREQVLKVRGLTRYGYVIKNSGDFVLQTSIEMAFELFRAHESLRDQEARLATLLNTIPDLVWLKDADGVYLACNPAFESFFGASEKEIVGKTDAHFISPELAGFFRQKDLEAVAKGGPNANEEWITFASDGHRAYLETIKTPMLDGSGRLLGVLGIGRDITERSRMQEALRSSERTVRRKLEALIEPTGKARPAARRATSSSPTMSRKASTSSTAARTASGTSARPSTSGGTMWETSTQASTSTRTTSWMRPSSRSRPGATAMTARPTSPRSGRCRAQGERRSG